MKLLVTVDTEADDQWKADGSTTIENVFALPRFQALCEKYAIVPTYFTTYEVASDARAAAMLAEWQEKGLAEIGAHLHPWTTSPFFPGESGQSFPSELSDESLRAKLAALTDALARRIGKRPTSYRAGRWGFDERQAKLLAELGYLVDSSITPGISWKETKGLVGGAGGPDFTNESAEPHRLSSGVLEVPMTILPAGLFRRLRWLRIFQNTTLWRLMTVIVAAKRKKLPAVVFMIHSSELVAGGSPYVQNAAALEVVYARLEELFKYCAKGKIEGVSLSGFARECGL